jgi:hypothetical protein
MVTADAAFDLLIQTVHDTDYAFEEMRMTSAECDAAVRVARAAYDAAVVAGWAEPSAADSETHCHCGAPYNGCDHCPDCFCEQYERRSDGSTWCVPYSVQYSAGT